MPKSNLLHGARLSSEQADQIKSVADALKKVGKPDNSAWDIAVSIFEKDHQIRNGSWLSTKENSEEKDKSFTHVEKQADGSYWITAVSTADVLDREGETFGIEAMDYDIKEAQRLNDYPEFRVFHSKHLGIGKVEKMSRVGIFAIDEGKSYTDPFSLQVCEKMLVTNNGTYRCSRGFRVIEASGACPDCNSGLVIKEDHFYGFTCPICMSKWSRYKELNGVRYRKARTFDVTITDIPCVPMTGAKAIKLPVEDGIMTKEELKKRLQKAGLDEAVIDVRLDSVSDEQMKQYDEQPFAEVLKEFTKVEKEEESDEQMFVLDPDVLQDFSKIVGDQLKEALDGISIEIPDTDIVLKEVPGLAELASEVAELKEMVAQLLEKDEQRLKEMVSGAPRSSKLRIQRAVYKGDKKMPMQDEMDEEMEEGDEEEMGEEEKKQLPPYLQKLLVSKEDGNDVSIVGADGEKANTMTEFILGGKA